LLEEREKFERIIMKFMIFWRIFVKMIHCEKLTKTLTYIGDERDAWTNEEMPHGLGL
jgi:hypothetical protein